MLLSLYAIGTITIIHNNSQNKFNKLKTGLGIPGI